MAQNIVVLHDWRYNLSQDKRTAERYFDWLFSPRSKEADCLGTEFRPYTAGCYACVRCGYMMGFKPFSPKHKRLVPEYLSDLGALLFVVEAVRRLDYSFQFELAYRPTVETPGTSLLLARQEGESRKIISRLVPFLSNQERTGESTVNREIMQALCELYEREAITDEPTVVAH